MTVAPVALFVYNRPHHTLRTLEALQKNTLANHTELFIFSDGPKEESQASAVAEVRELIQHVSGFKTVTVFKRETNLGLAASIIQGVTDIVEKYGRIIVLEDDLVTSAYFLEFMNAGLDRYEQEDRVISVVGYWYPISDPLSDTFLLKGADCWGWATWKRGWDLFNPNGSELLDRLTNQNLLTAFDLNHTYPYVQMLKDQISGKNNSWAIRWQASAHVHDKLSLYPHLTLVHNIGFDNSGTHCAQGSGFDNQDSALIDHPVHVAPIPIEENRAALSALERFMKCRQKSVWARLVSKIKRMVCR